MNQEILKSIVRQVAIFAGGTTVGVKVVMWLGFDPADLPLIAEFLFVITTAGASVWAIRTRRKAAIVAQAAAKVSVPIASQVAAGIPEDKINTAPATKTISDRAMETPAVVTAGPSVGK